MEKCRTCLIDTTNCKQIFQEENLLNKLKILTSVDISEEESSTRYPKTICEICLNTINNFYTFRNKVIDCDLILKTTIQKQLNTETPDENHIKLAEISDNNDYLCKIEYDLNDWQNDLQIDEENILEENYFFKQEEEIDSDETKDIDMTKNIDKSTKTDRTTKTTETTTINNATTINSIAVKNKITTMKKTKNQNKSSRYFKIPCEICGALITEHVMYQHLSAHERKDIKSSQPKIKTKYISRKLKPDKTGYHCRYCDFTTDTADALTEHRKEHINLKFSDATKVKSEILKTENGIVYVCPICGERFEQQNIFYKHKVKMHTPLSDLITNCQICGKSVQKTELKNHKMIHEKDAKRTCEICGKVSKNKICFRIHLKMHNKINRVCEICGKHFEVERTYIGHMNKHKAKAAMSLKCQFCDKKFWSKDVLDRHENSHTGHRPYPCEICNKKFSSKYALKGHKRQHTNEHPFVCTECPKAFHHRVSMKTHMKRAHGIDLFNKTNNEEAGTSNKANE